MGTRNGGGLGMKVISFHLKGKMAHFRRYYSNSSALSYTIPPRTTIVGMIAGLLGYERDSYYEEFSTERCKVAVGVRSPIKKQIHKLNLLMVKKSNDLNASQEHHSQTATEVVMPENIRSDMVDYQIWMAHTDQNIMNQFSSLFTEIGYKTKGVSLALGTAQNLAWIESCEMLNGSGENEGEAAIQSVIPVKHLGSLNFVNERVEQYRLLKEDIPLSFDHERRLKDKGNMLINMERSPVYAQVSRYVSLDSGECVVWME